MSIPPPPVQQHPVPSETELSQSSSRYRCSRSCERTLSWRGWLVYLALLLIIIIIVGIVCTAHVAYHSMGGQGYLKLKHRSHEKTYEEAHIPQVYLPTRQFAIHGDILGSNKVVRSPASVPYYTCGDQQNSCEAYGHAEICCPVQMICRPTTHTASHIYCCNGTLTHHKCHLLRARARCRPEYHECPANLGGGCCPNTMTCFKNQCIPVFDNSSLSNHSTAPMSTLLPGAPVPREGEIAEGSRVKSTLWSLGYPYSTLGILGCIAVVMGML